MKFSRHTERDGVPGYIHEGQNYKGLKLLLGEASKRQRGIKQIKLFHTVTINSYSGPVSLKHPYF